MRVRKINYSPVTEECILVRLRKIWYCSYLHYICHATLQTFFVSSTKKIFSNCTAVLWDTGNVWRAFGCSETVMGSKYTQWRTSSQDWLVQLEVWWQWLTGTKLVKCRIWLRGSEVISAFCAGNQAPQYSSEIHAGPRPIGLQIKGVQLPMPKLTISGED